MGIPGWQEILLILVVVLVLFGSKKLPEIGSGLGRALQNFRRATQEPDEIDITPNKKKTKKSAEEEEEDEE